ncbi:methionine--tRNA ligase [Candidatus Dependentiae bacterium]|nr:methionine--tRNA ligase [Candidatus Dependentiae bacterium]
MIDSKKKFYVTTPIYYVTAKPHLGSLYSTLLADVAARWHKLRGYNTFFLTGTDEHGQKVAEAAAKAGKQPQEFVDSFIDNYKDMWHKYEIEYNEFIRTTDTAHVKAVQEWLKRLQESGAIYKSYYTGYYCTPCETFVTEKDASLQENEQEPVCPSCSRATAAVSEESYFFKLSEYQDKLLKFYKENPDFITPRERFNEVISFVKGGLRDLSISRTTVSWGIPFPEDTKHVTYVWADALNNYITAIGYGNPARQEELTYWWPADMQVMGKDIVRFHAVYWPAFLMASGLELPKKLLVHGWIKVNNQKMSKSLGNAVDPQVLLDTYGAEPIRYYLTRHMAITQDAEFSIEDLEQRITSDLANDLGNLLNRMVTLAHKFDAYKVNAPQSWDTKELALRASCYSMLELFALDMQEGYFYRALNSLWKFINDVNGYFHEQEPWKVIKTDRARFEQILSATCHSLEAIGILLSPVLPNKMAELLTSIGVTLAPGNDMVADLTSNPWNKKFMLHKIDNLFEKHQPEKIATEQQETATPVQPLAVELPAVNSITIDDFAKIMLLIGTIEQCEEVAKSDKLYKLQVNFGSYGIRQILSGIRQHFTPEELLNKQSIFVYNLEPRKLMGNESQGMMLLAENAEKKLTRATVEYSVPNGTRLK